MRDQEGREPPAELRSLPAVATVLRRPEVLRLVEEHGHVAVAHAVRETIARARAAVRDGGDASISDGEIRAAVERVARGSLRPVLNATGVIVHTNLGRVPLAEEALRAAFEIGVGYSTLEYDVETGRRGSRESHVALLLTTATGAEDALVVNNNAAAMLLALGTLAAGRDVIVSRGELVEIGGGFRIPDLLRQSGARLVEVGTTNRTHLSDYEGALAGGDALILKVHRSNFALVGFTTEVDARTLAELAHARGTLLVHDVGSGCMPAVADIAGEPSLAAEVRAGADVVAFSGDKLLGGPQAGVLLGRARLIEAMRRAPLYRALRPDKLTLAALHATLTLWRDAPEAIPLVRMLRVTPTELEERLAPLAAQLAALRPSWPIDVVASVARIGGGAAPNRHLESRALRVRAPSADALAARLRAQNPPVVAHIEDGAVLLDLRCVARADDERLAASVAAAVVSFEDAP